MKLQALKTLILVTTLGLTLSFKSSSTNTSTDKLGFLSKFKLKNLLEKNRHRHRAAPAPAPPASPPGATPPPAGTPPAGGAKPAAGATPPASPAAAPPGGAPPASPPGATPPPAGTPPANGTQPAADSKGQNGQNSSSKPYCKICNPRKDKKTPNSEGGQGNNQNAQGNQNGDKPILEGPFSICSDSFENSLLFPKLPDKEGVFKKIDYDPIDKCRLNKQFPKGLSQMPTEKDFYLRLKPDILYYSNSKPDMVILDNMPISSIDNVQRQTKDDGRECVVVQGNAVTEICNKDVSQREKLICAIKKLLKANDMQCDKNNQNGGSQGKQKKIKIQELNLIAKESPMCNADWDYKGRGKDWECQCKKEPGRLQSPIDLPDKGSCPPDSNNLRFKYSSVGPKVEVSSLGGYSKGQYYQKTFEHNTPMIKADNLGTVIDEDGESFRATEVTFHVPSQHTIAGQNADLEVQVRHLGVSAGSLGQELSFSVLYNSKSGAQIKFFEDYDISKIPDMGSPKINLERPINLSDLLVKPQGKVDMADIPYYHYKGSLPYPPCTNDTEVYVFGEVLNIDSVTVGMIKNSFSNESLKGDNMIEGDSKPNVAFNNREIQDSDNRVVQFHTAENYNSNATNDENNFHWEKILRRVTKKLLVEGPKPSNIGGAFTVEKNQSTNK